MVRDGYFYGLGSATATALIIWFAGWPRALPFIIPVFLLGSFCLWFFRDPERAIPTAPGAIVSPGDGKVTDVSVPNSAVGSPASQARISIFLHVFNVHVNRCPIAGTVRSVEYQRGKFLNAMAANSADENEQTIITVDAPAAGPTNDSPAATSSEAQLRSVTFKQIAGLIARRIICNIKAGDTVSRGQRMGLIKFGSRVDVLFDADAAIQVKVGDHVQGGSSILAVLPASKRSAEPTLDRNLAGASRADSAPREASWKN